MPAPDFLDTNVLVYAYDATAPERRQIAQELVRRALAGEMQTSSQVIGEFVSTLLHKLTPPIKPTHMLTILDALEPIKAVAVDVEMIRRAIEAKASFGIHFYDGLIIASAERAGSTRIWSEDLNPGQKYFGIRVENPFV